MQTINLSHWDFAEMFTARQAALLIMGFDPSADEAKNINVEHVVKRMRDDCTIALMRERGLANGEDLNEIDELWPERYCLRFTHLLHLDPNDTKMSDLNFDSLNFFRGELVNWLFKNNLPSVYNFNHDSTCKYFEPRDKEIEKPFGSRERKSMLRTIAALLLVLESTGMSEAQTIKWLHDQGYKDGYEGLSKSKLEERFAEAKRIMRE